MQARRQCGPRPCPPMVAKATKYARGCGGRNRRRRWQAPGHPSAIAISIPPQGERRRREVQPRGTGRCRHPPRVALLPPEEGAARSAAHHRAPFRRAPRQTDRARRPVPGLHLLHGVWNRGDPLRAGQGRRSGRLQPSVADHPGRHSRALVRHPLIPRGRHGLHASRRLVCRGEGELRGEGGADRGSRLDHRLRRDRCRSGRGGDRRLDVGFSCTRARRASRCDLGGRRGTHVLRQPARDPRGGAHVRPSDVPVHHRDRFGDHHRPHPGRARPVARALDPPPRCRAHRHARQRTFLRGRDHHRAAGLRQRRLVADGPRGDLERGLDVPPARRPQCPPGARHHVDNPRLTRVRGLAPRPHHPRRALLARLPDGALPGGGVRLRLGLVREVRLLLRSGRHDADPLDGRQHELQRVPQPRQLRRGGLLPSRTASRAAATGSSSRTGSSSSPSPPRRFSS